MGKGFFVYRCWLLSLLLLLVLLSDSPHSVEAAAPADAIDKRDDVQKAVIQIENHGVFADLSWGSGFIIDPSGIAVTNNHVVNGAAELRVHVDGKTGTLNAHVLGASECADLAVIQLDGANFPYLQWSDKPVKVGLDVYAAGFPLGDPEFTLTKGIIAKAKANGNTSWASVDHVLEHDANINPGSSGGPLIDTDGRVIGINYANNQSTRQSFAIARDIAQSMIAQLQIGKSSDFVGIDGEAFSNDDGSSGIQIQSVASGSPADKAGIKLDDILIGMEDSPLALDGTLKTYCELLRNHAPTDTLAIQVMRNGDEIWEGQLNGRALRYKGHFAYTYVWQSSKAVNVQLPVQWADQQSDDWLDPDTKEKLGKIFTAAPNLTKFRTRWNAPGVIVHTATGVTVAIDVNKWLDNNFLSKNCHYEKRVEHRHTVHGQTYIGAYGVWNNCGGQDVTYYYLVAVSEPLGQLVLIDFRAEREVDNEAWSKLLASFYMGESPPPTTVTSTLCTGQTNPETTIWRAYSDGKSTGIYVDIDTSACQFAQTPLYLTSLGGDGGHRYATGVSTIYRATPTGFRVYLRNSDDRPLIPQLAQESKWYINWSASPPTTVTSTLCTGQTNPETTIWQAYSDGKSTGIYVDIDTSACQFAQTPLYLTSLGGNGGHWYATGVSTIYRATPTGFRVYLRNSDDRPLIPQLAQESRWYINWSASPAATVTSTLCTGQTNPETTTWQAYSDGKSTGIYVDIDTNTCQFAQTPLYLTSLGGNGGHRYATGASTIYRATPTGFRVYLRNSDGRPLTPQLAQESKWYINWSASSAQ